MFHGSASRFCFCGCFPLFQQWRRRLTFRPCNTILCRPAAAHIRCADERISWLDRSLCFAGIPSNARSISERKISVTFMEAICRGGGARYCGDKGCLANGDQLGILPTATVLRVGWLSV